MTRTHIVLHHSLTKDSASVSWAAIERYHREVKGWRDIGYHAGIELVASPALGRYAYQGLVGRAEDDIAAACVEAHMNECGLHLCLVGDFDIVPPPQAMLERAVLRFIRPWARRYNISPDCIIGHRDAGLMEGHDWRHTHADGSREYKSCPGAAFDLDLVRLMSR